MNEVVSGATLRGREGAFKGVNIPIPVGGLILGREAAGADRLAFDAHSDVSRKHCSVRFDDALKSFTVTDHGSSNGTFLLPQEERLPAHQGVACRNGQLIRVGHENIFELVASRSPGATASAPESSKTPALPVLGEQQRLDLKAIRVPYERFYLAFVLGAAGLAVLLLVIVLLSGFASDQGLFSSLALLAVLGSLGLASWINWKLSMAFLLGHSIKVGPNQYPQIHALVSEASEVMGVVPPTVLILQGHGMFELYIARRFSRRGVLIVTSNLLDDLAETGSSREFMFFVGRQLGLIASGFFDWWFIKHTLGQFALPFYLGWKRRCHLTADRLGLLVAGDPVAAEQALLIIAAGMAVAANTRMVSLQAQREEIFSSVWSWLVLGFSGYPYMVDRIVRLREFSQEARRRGIQANAPAAIGTLQIQHRAIRALPIIIVHGHDRTARLELENFLRKSLPHVEPILMIDETDAMATLPEKFERLGRGAKGVLALLTPDDVAMAQSDGVAHYRARQNVIGEMFFFWAKLGRSRLLLLTRGELEIPSDFAGADVHRFAASPIECSEAVRQFISSVERQ